MTTEPTATDLRCEYLVDPLGIDVVRPRLSWVVEAPGRGVVQAAYRIVVADTQDALGGDQHRWDSGRHRWDSGQHRWDSGWVSSSATAHVEYGGPPLRSGQRAWWTVAVRTADGRTSGWARPAWWERGLDDAARSVDWIAAPEMRVPCLRRRFALDRPVVRARLYATALGVYRITCNGTRVGDDWFAPGWTDYRRRLTVRAYDVTELLREGPNAIGAVLADGWYSGYLGFQAQREHYGEHPALLVQLVVEHDDGSISTIATDDAWRAHAGPWLSADFQMGERYDARRELRGWDEPGFDDSAWAPVRITSGTDARLTGPVAPGVGVLAELSPRSTRALGEGTVLVDFGQNLAGWVRIAVRGPAGRLVRLRFAEMLGPHGGIHTENLRGARSTDEYILSGHGEETWEPSFTYHGFRYVEVSGWPGELRAGDLTAVACGTRLRDTGSFECSAPALNRLQDNIVWSQRSNFVDVPTDCPQRDERLGWLGDAQVFAATACFNQDVAPFFTKWMRDVVDAQSAEGAFPNVAPRVVDVSDGMPGWGDAGVIVPWRMWEWYADRRLLTEVLPACARWVEYVHAASPDGTWSERRGYDVGDWLSFEVTPKDVIATAYAVLSAEIVARMAGVAGDARLETRMRAIAGRALDAFRREFVRDDGSIEGGTQTAYALALRFGLVPEELRDRTASHLAAAVERLGHLTVGFLGVEHLLPALTDGGRLDLAYRLALADTMPSWGYAVRHGATTIWERWDGWTEERGLHDPAMNSFNHYAYGSIGTWLYGTVAGIAVEGAARFRIAPRPGPGLDWARGRYRSLWGEVACGWTRRGDGLADSLDVEVTVPANATARLVLPAGDDQVVEEDGVPLEDVEGVRDAVRRAGVAEAELGSGSYRFVVRRP